MKSTIELRAHAGAPSSRKDDDRCRAQAEAYLVFQGITLNFQREECSENGDSASEEVGRATNLAETSIFKHTSTTFIDDTQLAWTALDSQLHTSSLTITPRTVSKTISSSPRLTEASRAIAANKPAAENFDESESHPNRTPFLSSLRKRKLDADESPALVLENGVDPATANPVQATQSDEDHSLSSYLRSPILDRSNKKQRLKSNRNHPHKFVPALREESQATGIKPGITAYVDDRPPPSTEPANIGRSEWLQDSNRTSELPTSYSLSDITSASSRARRALSQRSSSDVGRRASTSPIIVRNDLQAGDIEFKAMGKTNEGSLHEITASGAIVGQNFENDTPIPVGTHNANASQRKTSPQPPESVLADRRNDLAIEIRAPEPTISELEYTTHVTRPFKTLANDPNMSTVYSPISTTRELRSLERGHWLIDCTSPAFPLQTQVKFWKYLEQTIAGGHAGWGVWCHREAVERADDHARHSLGVVKMFCWGEVVEHTYLLLYVASVSKVRKLGLQWIDAEGKVVVQMRGT